MKQPFAQKLLVGQWILIAVLMVVTVVFYTISVRTSECLDTYMQENHDAQVARSEANARANDALDDMLDAMLMLKTPEERRQALVNYNKLRDAEKLNRTKNPLPEVPKHC